MKQKTRKNLAAEWEAFQQKHQLADDLIEALRRIHHRFSQFRRKLPEPLEGDLGAWIRDYLASPQVGPKTEGKGRTAPRKSPTKNSEPAYDPLWAKAKKPCRLSARDVEIAKELGLKPRSLMKNIPGPDQRWKAPVKPWIHGLHEKRVPRKAGDRKNREEPRQDKDLDG